MSRPARTLLFALVLYCTLCTAAGLYLPDGVLHPQRRPLTDDEIAAVRGAGSGGATLQYVSIQTADGIVLQAWLLRPRSGNGNSVIVLHGLSDNRGGMTGYAQLFLAHGYSVLMPDARAHGSSGGELATYGLLERNDIHQWVNFLQVSERPHCIFGFGESMGAAQLLQSLQTDPNFCAVAAESPFASFREIAYDRMGQPFHLGPWVGRTLLRPVIEIAFWRARSKYGLNMEDISPMASVGGTKIPVLLIHGVIDGNIPVRHSRLIQARNPRAQLWEVPGADHCGAMSAAPQEFEDRVIAWFSSKYARNLGDN